MRGKAFIDEAEEVAVEGLKGMKAYLAYQLESYRPGSTRAVHAAVEQAQGGGGIAGADSRNASHVV